MSNVTPALCWTAWEKGFVISLELSSSQTKWSAWIMFDWSNVQQLNIIMFSVSASWHLARHWSEEPDSLLRMWCTQWKARKPKYHLIFYSVRLGYNYGWGSRFVSILTLAKSKSQQLRLSWHFEKGHLDCWEIFESLKNDISTKSGQNHQ